MEVNKKQVNNIVTEETKNRSAQRDMSEIYFRLGARPVFVSQKCPTLFCDTPMPDGVDYLTILYNNNPILINTRIGLSDEDVYKIVIGATEDFDGLVQPCPVELERFFIAYVTKCNNASFYHLGSILAKSLNIPCPQIIIMNELSERSKIGRGNTKR